MEFGLAHLHGRLYVTFNRAVVWAVFFKNKSSVIGIIVRRPSVCSIFIRKFYQRNVQMNCRAEIFLQITLNVFKWHQVDVLSKKTE